MNLRALQKAGRRRPGINVGDVVKPRTEFRPLYNVEPKERFHVVFRERLPESKRYVVHLESKGISGRRFLARPSHIRIVRPYVLKILEALDARSNAVESEVQP